MLKIETKYQKFNRDKKIQPISCMTLSHSLHCNPSPCSDKTLFIKPGSQPQGHDLPIWFFFKVLQWSIIYFDYPIAHLLLALACPTSPHLSDWGPLCISWIPATDQEPKGSRGRLLPEAVSQALSLLLCSVQPLLVQGILGVPERNRAQIALGWADSLGGLHHALGFWSWSENCGWGGQRTPIRTPALCLFGLPDFPGRSASLSGIVITLKPLICVYCFFIHSFSHLRHSQS